MTKRALSVSQKLGKLEDQKKMLLRHRKEEIFKLLQDNNGLQIDDELLVGFIKFMTKPENLQNPIINQFKEETASSRIPKRKISIPKKIEENFKPN